MRNKYTIISLGTICLTFFLLETPYLLHQINPWWDSGIYIAMGKYIFSLGKSGFFEASRPLLLPFILGLGWKLGLNPNYVGIAIGVISSLVSIVLVFIIGEKIKKYAGLFSALLLGFTILFFSYSVIPLTDILSTAIALLALLLILNKKYSVSGFLLFLAFMSRFPIVLLAAPFIIYIFIQKESRSTKIKSSLYFLAGLSLPIAFYLALNAIVYHNALLPIILGSASALSSGIYNYDALFYIKNIAFQNPLLVFSLVAFIPYFQKPKEVWRSPLTFIWLSFLTLLFYFTNIAHKEVRYALSFLPYLALLAGFGIALLLEKIGDVKKIIIACILFLLLVSSIIIIVPHIWLIPEDSSYQAYYTFFANKNNATILTSSPQIALYSDAKLTIFDDWTKLDGYLSNKETGKFLAIDTCQVTNETSLQNTMLSRLNSTLPKELDVTSSNGCELLIYDTK